MVWYSHFSKNFPQFVMIYTVKVFSIVDETEIDVFLTFCCFFYNPENVANPAPPLATPNSAPPSGQTQWKALSHWPWKAAWSDQPPVIGSKTRDGENGSESHQTQDLHSWVTQKLPFLGSHTQRSLSHLGRNGPLGPKDVITECVSSGDQVLKLICCC